VAFGSIGSGIGSVGNSIGRVVGSTVKKATSGSSVGRSVSRAAKTTRKASSSSRRSSSSGRSSSSRSSSSRSSSNRGSSGGGGGGRASTPKAPKAPSVPSLNAYLGTDAAYQNVVRGGQRSLADFISELGRRRGEAGTQFTMTKSSMERDRTQQLEDLRNEFASRGLIQSGLYGEEQGRFQKQFQEQQTALEQQQAALLADLLGQEKNYRRENDLALEAAKQEALQRRAAKYKIGA